VKISIDSCGGWKRRESTWKAHVEVLNKTTQKSTSFRGCTCKQAAPDLGSTGIAGTLTLSATSPRRPVMIGLVEGATAGIGVV
jgi:hypothetical protein